MSAVTDAPAFEKLLTRPEVAEALGIAITTLDLWVRTGKFVRPLRMGGRTVRWRKSDLAEWLNQRSSSGA